MTLQRQVPPNIKFAQAKKVAESPTPFVRRSLRADLSLPIRPRYFALSGGAESQQLSPAWMRGYLLIQNNGAFTMYLDFDKKASAYSIQIPPGGNFESTYVCPCGSVNVYSAADVIGIIAEG